MKSNVVAAFLLLISASANSALLSTDWKNPGDSLSSVDDKTGIEWMDVNQTRNYSITSILPELNIGGKFEGWRLPTHAEVLTLFKNQFGEQALSIASSTSSSSLVAKGFVLSQVQDFAKQIGGGYYGSSGYLYNGAMFKRDDGKQGFSGFIVAGSGFVPNGWYFNPTTNYFPSVTYSNSQYGVYLVNDGGVTLSSINNPQLNIKNPNAPINNEPVPVSAPVLLGVLSLFALGRGRKRFGV